MLMLLEFLFISGLIVFVSKRKHLLLMLLSLEFLVLVLFLNLFFFLSFMNYESFFSMIFLTMSVCEGSLGLSIMVNMIRTYGNDYIMTFTFLW
uniref:NADH-ubiquinone oxidoreductase chain 4L n=1 Tax=Palaestes abruptus TaxID=2528286 RepID=A0A7G7MUA5_9CUCU|nr:NADH dehydrogenase subunit 4L [Palaestes abruptus]QNG56284.1 NADH dehydrogenase subunit 4L [Palaestes abruptus]QNG56414.1 NADH dehydrogenase subunit 4L [Palaestes abruptus]